jgi:drug/metabolite transporter (DMT)-like permease
MSINTTLILLTITGLTLVGDYCIKIASAQSHGLTSSTFVIGLILYGLPAIGWFLLMRDHSLAVIGVFYSASTILMLAAMGYFVFNEQIGLREGVGLSLAVASVIVMSVES